VQKLATISRGHLLCAADTKGFSLTIKSLLIYTYEVKTPSAAGRARIPAVDLLGFGLDADVSLSQLRNGEEWTDKLREHQKLRVQRRGDTLGVLLSKEAWHAIGEQIMRCDAIVEQIEDAEAERLIDQRSDAKLEQGAALKRKVLDRLSQRPEFRK